MPAPLLKTLATFALALGLTSVQADPGYYVVNAYSDPGVQVVDFRYWATRNRNRPQVVWPEVGLGYGVNSRWYTELFGSAIGPSVDATRLDSINWQNDVLLTQGEWPFDLALHTQLIRNLGASNVLEYGPALQTDVGRTQLNLNLILERKLSGRSSDTLLKYQWQVRHRWQPLLNFGLQGFGEVGPWNDFLPRARQSHRAGPALFGRVDIDDTQALHWQAALLRGKVFGRSGQMFTLQVKYTH
jgi:hypothetical protein